MKDQGQDNNEPTMSSLFDVNRETPDKLSLVDDG